LSPSKADYKQLENKSESSDINIQRVSVIRRPITPSAQLLEGVSSLLGELQEAKGSDSSVEIVSPVQRRKHISTDPNFL